MSASKDTALTSRLGGLLLAPSRGEPGVIAFAPFFIPLRSDGLLVVGSTVGVAVAVAVLIRAGGSDDIDGFSSDREVGLEEAEYLTVFGVFDMLAWEVLDGFE